MRATMNMSMALTTTGDRGKEYQDLLDDESVDDNGEGELLDSLAGKNNSNKINGFLERVRDVHLNMEKGKGVREVVTTGDLVAETDYSFEFEFFQLEKMIPERVRSLKPTPKVRTPQSLQVGNCNLLVQVVGCKNVPLRVDVCSILIIFYILFISMLMNINPRAYVRLTRRKKW